MYSLKNPSSGDWPSLAKRFENSTFLPFPPRVIEDTQGMVLVPRRPGQDTIIIVVLVLMGAGFLFMGLSVVWGAANQTARVVGGVFAGVGLVSAAGSAWSLLRCRRVRLDRGARQLIFSYGLGPWQTSVRVDAEDIRAQLSFDGPGASDVKEGHVFLTLIRADKGGEELALAVADSRESLTPACGALASLIPEPVYDQTLRETRLNDGSNIRVSQASIAVGTEAGSPGDATIGAYRIKFTSPHVAHIAPTASAWLSLAGCFLFALFFLAMVVVVVMSIESWHWWSIFFPVMFCFPALLAVAGVFDLFNSLQRSLVILDRRRGRLLRVRQGLHPQDDLDAVALDDIVALQVCSKKVKTGGGKYGGSCLVDSYQLNLVLREGAPETRLNLMAHCKRKYLLEDARRLAEFLGKPLLLPQDER
jgi:MFS family permease